MEGLLSVIHGVSSADSNYFNIYVDGLDEQVSGLQADQLNDVQNISSQLSKATTRPLGLRLLNKFLEYSSAEVFNKTGNLWTSLALKACHPQMQPSESSLAYEVLGKIAFHSLQTPELTKSFATGHLSKVYESLNHVPIECAGPALRCVETCLKLYPASSGPSRRTIEKFVARFHDSLQADIVIYNGKCLHLLQQVSGGEIRSSSHKSQWKSYQTQLVGSIHAIFDDMFANCNEMWDDSVVQEHLTLEKLELSDEPVNRAAQLYIRYHNLMQYLIVALKEPFPVEKPILPKMLLGLINRGLSVTCNLLHQNPITDNIAIALLMPKVHIDLLHLLDSLVSVLRGHLLPYYNLILALLMDIMKSTSCSENNGNQKPFGLLRGKIYESISLWCRIQSSASRCDVIAEYLINEILADIIPEQNELTLQVCAGAGKHMSKKMKRQLHKAQNERSKISKPAIKAAKHTMKAQKEDRQQMVCTSALRCLQEMLLSVASFLKPTKIKLLQTTLLQICGNFYELPLDSCHLYNNARCRLECFNVVYVMVTTPHHLSPPPMDLVLMLLNNACCRDGNIGVRNHCKEVIQNLEKLIHPQKESLVFPVDGRDIRNAFIMLGQERLLGDPMVSALNKDESDDENQYDKHLTNEDKTSNDEVQLIEEIDDHVENEDIVELMEHESDEEDVQLIGPGDDEDCKIVSPSSNGDAIENVNYDQDDDDCRIVSLTANYDQGRENQKSPDIVLRVDDCDSPMVQQEEDVESNDEVSSPKKSRIENEIDKEEENGKKHLDESLNMDDDQLLEDIAASFVDDLA
ncbi:proline-, glutamic acid- and leucine-rich protein 1 [Stomoxys calcitrans]|uniref:proline-, glutamic acid- and leucine-rich protein 1 n=1 Tax=Stomoxys calcitrans TaxID=35570 RepID=UPI0027E25099|nr:proline-, glutamic acid- and leucine-rich protein 1 [Stomoxys calcitrans]